MTMPKPQSGPHTRDNVQVSWIMREVMLAMVPATAFGILLFGWPALYLFLVTVASAAVFEAACLMLAGRPVKPALTDGSAILTGWIFALTLPPWAPWWVGVVGSAVAIVLGKQVYGGLGQNLFNPAMLARVALLVSFPVQLTTWSNAGGLFGHGMPGPVDAWAITFGAAVPADGMTGATFIGAIKTGFSEGVPLSTTLDQKGYSLWDTLFGLRRGSLGETSTLLILAGGVYLLRKRIITWHIPVSMLLTVVVIATVFHLVNPERYADPGFHLTTGTLMFAAFFIATDYVTSPSSPVGQIVFGAGCGLLVFIIRSWGGYPEGAAFAVLLMNAVTPLIDHYIRPRIYGRDRRGRPLELP